MRHKFKNRTYRNLVGQIKKICDNHSVFVSSGVNFAVLNSQIYPSNKKTK